MHTLVHSTRYIIWPLVKDTPFNEEYSGLVIERWAWEVYFEPRAQQRHFVLSPLARHFILCLVLVQPRKPSRNDCKIVDWDVKNQLYKKTYNLHLPDLRSKCTLLPFKTHPFVVCYMVPTFKNKTYFFVFCTLKTYFLVFNTKAHHLVFRVTHTLVFIQDTPIGF